MNKLIIFLLCFFLVGCDTSCKLKGVNVCVDLETNLIQVEEDAHIKVAVENEQYGEALKELWNKVYPDHVGVLDYTVYYDFDYDEYMNNPTDLALLWDSYAIRMQDYFRDIDKANEDIRPFLAQNFIINTNHFNYVPMSGFGSVFSYNKTMLETLGLDSSDLNGDNLPDSFDTFEEIIELVDDELIYNEKPVDFVFPIDFDDYLTGFTFTTLGFDIFKTDKADEPGFDSEEFLNSLQMISELGNYFPETDYLYEQYLHDEISPFGIAFNWMYFLEEEDINVVEFKYSAFPTYKGFDFKPLAHSKGYMISKSSLYPSACNAVLNLIRSNEGLNLYLANTDSILLFNHYYEYGEDEKRYDLHYQNDDYLDISKAYLSSQIEDYSAFELFNNIQGFEVVDEINLNNIYKQVFMHELTADEAFRLTNDLSNKWIKPFLPVEDEE